ncbi:hypothetical protein BGZ82_001549 [Podila clonocystis]|nr:hypothetical protein BGZ82_001549 [Podila clonocystis]
MTTDGVVMVGVEVAQWRFKNLALIACVASVAFAQVDSLLCQTRAIVNTATCILGVKECNVVENFGSCVCAHTGSKPEIRSCLAALLSNVHFTGTITAADIKA